MMPIVETIALENWHRVIRALGQGQVKLYYLDFLKADVFASKSNFSCKSSFANQSACSLGIMPQYLTNLRIKRLNCTF